MKQHFKRITSLILIVCMVSAFALSAAAAPAEAPTTNGIYDLKIENATLGKVAKGDGKMEAATAVTKSQTSVGEFYADAEQFELTPTGLAKDVFALIFVVYDGNDAAAPAAAPKPDKDNLWYIDQKTGSQTVAIFPKTLQDGSYSIWMTTSDHQTKTLGTFRYYQGIIPGDVNGDGKIYANDAQYALQIATNAKTIQIQGVATPVTAAMMKAADVDKSDGEGKIYANDAQRILQMAVNQ